VSVDEVREYLNDLGLGACGPDGFPPPLLKECCDQIAPGLSAIINRSLNSGKIPREWKTANVTPIHKKDSKKPVENYRPYRFLQLSAKYWNAECALVYTIT